MMNESKNKSFPRQQKVIDEKLSIKLIFFQHFLSCLSIPDPKC